MREAEMIDLIDGVALVVAELAGRLEAAGALPTGGQTDYGRALQTWSETPGGMPPTTRLVCLMTAEHLAAATGAGHPAALKARAKCQARTRVRSR